jgi:hypothetical protein
MRKFVSTQIARENVSAFPAGPEEGLGDASDRFPLRLSNPWPGVGKWCALASKSSKKSNRWLRSSDFHMVEEISMVMKLTVTTAIVFFARNRLDPLKKTHGRRCSGLRVVSSA